MDHLKNTDWFLVKKIGDSGWTVHLDSAREPGDFLSFKETHLVNWNFLIGSEGIPYIVRENEIQTRDGKWEIDQYTLETLILNSYHKKYIYRKIELYPQKIELPKIENQLINGIWGINQIGGYSSMLCLFLREKLEKSEDFLPNYSIMLKVAYHQELMNTPSNVSTMSGWKLHDIEKSFFLSLYDLENGHQHLELKNCTENQILFKGEFELKLEKINKSK